MKEYKIKIKKPVDCQSCTLWNTDNYSSSSRCVINPEINDSIYGFAYYKEIHANCPLGGR